MKHLSKTDLSALNIHNEYGNIMSEEYYLKVTKHLDNCEICKKRYIYDGVKIIDKQEEIFDELLLEMFNIATQNFDFNMYVNKANEINIKFLNKMKNIGYSEDESYSIIKDFFSHFNKTMEEFK